MLKSITSLFILISCSIPALLNAQTNLYANDSIQIIQITFANPNWDYMMDTAYYGNDGYTMATQVVINGELFDSVGVRYKGNSTYDSTRVKNPFHIKLNFVHGNASYHGYTDLKLANGWSDPSNVREVLAYDMLHNYMNEPQSNFAKIYVNGVYYGVYTNNQNIDGDFLDQNFCSSDKSFFKANPQNVTNGHIPNLVYLGTDSSLYYDRYEMKSDFAWKDLINLCDVIVNSPNTLDTILDVDRTLWMLAFNDLTVNLDSYSGQFAQNYYLLMDHNGRMNPIIWDLNMCFGGFTNTGSANLNLQQEQTLTPFLHQANPARPLIKALLANSTWQKMYVAHMRTMNNEQFISGNYLTTAQQFHDLIDTSVMAENYSLYAYNDFQNSFNTSVGNIPGLQELMDTRSVFIDTSAIFQLQPPVISSNTNIPSAVSFGSTVFITAIVTNCNSNAVFLGYRLDKCDRFYRVPMYDDGLHNDGIANDNVFGASIAANSLQIQYYIYAENNDAGIFSPQRAEHEFYSIEVSIQQATMNTIVINEVMADNQNGITNEDGNHKDWIELYNTTNTPLGLKNFYLSDDNSNLEMWHFPSNSFIAANGHLLIWADDKDTTFIDMHTNFNLQNSGDSLYLVYPSTLGGVIDDSVNYNFLGTDSSLERCPDGVGSFITTGNPTPRMSNCTNGIDMMFENKNALAFPNPADHEINFQFLIPYSTSTLVITNLLGQIFWSQENIDSSEPKIQTSNWPSGIYCWSVNNAHGKFIVQH